MRRAEPQGSAGCSRSRGRIPFSLTCDGWEGERERERTRTPITATAYLNPSVGGSAWVDFLDHFSLVLHYRPQHKRPSGFRVELRLRHRAFLHGARLYVVETPSTSQQGNATDRKEVCRGVCVHRVDSGHTRLVLLQFAKEPRRPRCSSHPCHGSYEWNSSQRLQQLLGGEQRVQRSGNNLHLAHLPGKPPCIMTTLHQQDERIEGHSEPSSGLLHVSFYTTTDMK